MLFLVAIIYGLSMVKSTNMAVSPNRGYKVERRPLYVPLLEELADGLSGNQKLLELGDVKYILPEVIKEKIYDLKDAAILAGVEPAFIIGPGAGPLPYTVTNADESFDIKIEKGSVNQQAQIVQLKGADEDMFIQVLPKNETRISCIGTLYISEGKPGKIIKIHVKKRTGPKDFVTTLRNAIIGKYGQQNPVGVAGTFLISGGKVTQHVMRNFTKTNVTGLGDDNVREAVKFFGMSAPLIALGTIKSNDGGDLDLIPQDFHSFSTQGEGGHYYNDTTPDTIEYLGYFNVAHEVVRIDKPTKIN